MASIVVLVRHGKAQADEEGLDDINRLLTDAGQRALDARFPDMFENLLRNPLYRPDDAVIWTSGAARADQTADAVSRATGIIDIDTHECLWQQDEWLFLNELAQARESTVIAVGHTPFVNEVSDKLCGYEMPFKTGAMAAFAIEGDLEQVVQSQEELCKQSAIEAQSQAAQVAVESQHQASVEPQSTGVIESQTQLAQTYPARLLWFVQGPKAADWQTVCTIEDTLGKRAMKLADSMQEFFDDPEDVETTHSLRVCIRTIRSLLVFLEPFQKKEQNKKLQEDLRYLVLKTSDLRDLDVLREQVEGLPDPAHDLCEAIAGARADECARTSRMLQGKKAQRALQDAVCQLEQIKWKKEIRRFGLPENDAISRYCDLVCSFEAELDACAFTRIESVHKLRKHAKQVRYISESFGRFLGSESKKMSEQMKQVQDDLGAICDAHVNGIIIENFSKDGLSDQALWDLNILKAKQDHYFYSHLKAHDAESKRESAEAGRAGEQDVAGEPE